MDKTHVSESSQEKKADFLFYGLLLYTVVFYSQIAARFPILMPFRVEFVLGSILIIFCLSKIITGKIDLKENRLNTAALLFLLVAFITIPLAFHKGHALNTFIRLLKFFAIYLMIISTIDNEKKLKQFLYIYIAMISLLFVQPFFLSLQGKGFIYNNHMWRLAGLTGYFAHPNGLAGITSANLPFFYYLMKHQRSIPLKIVFLSLIIIGIRVIMLTQSRTGFVGVVVFGFVIWIFSKRKLIALIIIVLSCMLAWHFAPQQTKDRITTFRDTGNVISGEQQTGSMAARWILIKHAFTLFVENPIIGVGIDNFEIVHHFRWNHWIPPHNTYLQALAEMGLIGFIVFLFVIITTFRNLNKARRILARANDQESFFYFLIHSVAAFLIVRLIVSNFGQELYENYWWVAGGLSLVILRIVKDKYDAFGVVSERS